MAESADLMDAIISQSEGQYSAEPPEGSGPGQPTGHIADYLFYKTSVGTLFALPGHLEPGERTAANLNNQYRACEMK